MKRKETKAAHTLKNELNGRKESKSWDCLNSFITVPLTVCNFSYMAYLIFCHELLFWLASYLLIVVHLFEPWLNDFLPLWAIIMEMLFHFISLSLSVSVNYLNLSSLLRRSMPERVLLFLVLRILILAGANRNATTDLRSADESWSGRRSPFVLEQTEIHVAARGRGLR